MMSRQIVFTGCFLLSLMLTGCGDRVDIDTSESYQWTQSGITPDFDVTVYQFIKEDDGILYINGWTSDDKSLFARHKDGQWEVVAETSEMVIGDFAFFDDTIYYSTSLAVKKARGMYIGTVLNTTTHCALEVYHDQLFIAGSHLLYEGEEYSILSYNKSKQFNPVFQGVSNSKIKKANDKLFITGPQGQPLIIYNNGLVQESTYRKDFLTVTDDESIYGHDNIDANHIVINKFSDLQTEKVGNTIQANMILTRLEPYKNSLVVSGHDLTDDTSNSYFLTSHGTWKPIDTEFLIFDLIGYQNKILAGSEGQIMELTLQ